MKTPRVMKIVPHLALLCAPVCLLFWAPAVFAQDKPDEATQRALCRAISRRDVEGVKTALAEGASPNLPNAWGNTPLHLAAFLNLDEITGLLREKGGDPTVKNINGHTPAFTAARFGAGTALSYIINTRKVNYDEVFDGETMLTALAPAGRSWDFAWMMRFDDKFPRRRAELATALSRATNPEARKLLHTAQLIQNSVDVVALEKAGQVRETDNAKERDNRPDEDSWKVLFNNSFDRIYNSAGANPLTVQLDFQTTQTVTGFFLFPTAFPVYRWKVEAADTPQDLVGKTGSFREVVPQRDTKEENGDLSPDWVFFAKPVTARSFRLTLQRMGGDDLVALAEWRLLTDGAPVSMHYEPDMFAQKPSQGVAEIQGQSSDWAGGNHYFWHDAQEGATLKFDLQVPATGRYEVRARFTQSPDFGTVEAQMDEQKLGDVDLFAEKTQPAPEQTIGTVQLGAGNHTLTLKLTGKNPNATNTFIGVDYFKLVPVP